VLDWLTTASEADKVAFVKVTQSLIECKSVVGSKGFYSKSIVENKRPAVVIWLKDSTEEQQMVFWEVMHAVSSVNHDGELVKKLMPYELVDEEEEEEKGKLKEALSLGKIQVDKNELTGDNLNFVDEEMIELTGLDDSIDDARGSKNVEIIGNLHVGGTLLVAGAFGKKKCHVRWFRVKPGEQTQKIPREHSMQYEVKEADEGCKLRVVVKPAGADKADDDVYSAVTGTITRPLEPAPSPLNGKGKAIAFL